jgi:hypothetical protein
MCRPLQGGPARLLFQSINPKLFQPVAGKRFPRYQKRCVEYNEISFGWR